MLGNWYDGIFTAITPINAHVRVFQLTFPELEKLQFTPGQFMTFDLPIHRQRQKRWRSYSIASAPNDSNTAEFVIVENNEGGTGTHYLFNEVQVGSTIKVREPQGVFNIAPQHWESELCLICTGTGIAPFRSALQDRWLQHSAPNAPIQLIFGTRQADGLLFNDEWEHLAQHWQGFSYLPTLSRPNAEWKGYKGYVHSIYEQLYADRRPAKFYLCGWNAMLDEAQQRLLAMGYTHSDIIFESYG